MNEIKQEWLDIGQDWLNRPVDDILDNISSLIDDINECDDCSIWGASDKLVQAFLSIPSEKLIVALITHLNQTYKTYLHIDAIGFPDVWFKLALNPVSRQQLVSRLANVSCDSYVYAFLNGIDEGDETPGEKAIRSILDELGYPIPRDASLDWSPCGKYRRVTKRALAELLEDPIANFSRIIDSIFCSNAEYWDYLTDHVGNYIMSIPPDTLVSLLISDFQSRQEVYPVPCDYTHTWLSIAHTEEFVGDLVEQLSRLPSDSCVIVYLNEVYSKEIASDPDHPLLISLRNVLELANVFVGRGSAAKMD